MSSYLRKLIAISSLVIFVYPINILCSYLTPWNDAIKQLHIEYPDDFFIQIGGATKLFFGSRKLVSGTYFLIPSGITVEITKVNNQPINIEEQTSGLTIFTITLIASSAIFIFFGLPELREIIRNKRVQTQ